MHQVRGGQLFWFEGHLMNLGGWGSVGMGVCGGLCVWLCGGTCGGGCEWKWCLWGV